MFSHKVQAQVFIDSKKRTDRSVSSTNFQFPLASDVRLPHSNDVVYEAVFTDINIPAVFDNISGDFNKLRILEDGADNVDITLSKGFYSIDELVGEVQTELNANTLNSITYTVAYDEITGIVTISRSGGTSIELVGSDTESTLAHALGFVVGTSYPESGGVITSPNKAFTNLQRHLKIVITNITGNNQYESDGLLSLSKIVQIDEGRAVSLNGRNNNDYPIQVSPNTYNQLRVLLMDADDNVIDLYNNDWSFSIVFLKRKRS